jgi:hypothetical protein
MLPRAYWSSFGVSAANQLRDQLACFWPGASKVFCSVDTGIAWRF